MKFHLLCMFGNTNQWKPHACDFNTQLCGRSPSVAISIHCWFPATLYQVSVWNLLKWFRASPPTSSSVECFSLQLQLANNVILKASNPCFPSLASTLLESMIVVSSCCRGQSLVCHAHTYREGKRVWYVYIHTYICTVFINMSVCVRAADPMYSSSRTLGNDF